MAEPSKRGRRNPASTGKRKAVGSSLIDVNNIVPVPCPERFKAGTNIHLRTDFNAACRGRGICVERMFDEQFLRDIDFPYLQRLKDWNMWGMFVTDNQVISNAVRVFYFRGDTGVYEPRPQEDPEEPDVEVRVGETDRAFRTRIDEEVINVDENLIRRYIRDVPNDSPTEVPDEDSFPYLEAFRQILEDSELDSTRDAKAEGMSLHNRILHLMVTQVLFPRCGDYSKATKRDIYWMYRIIKYEQPNVSGMIMTRMMEGMRNSKSNANSYYLPYGRLVSRICSDFCAIHPDEPKTAPPFKKPFNKKSLASLGWKFDKTSNAYVRKKERRRAEAQASTSANPGLEAVLAALNQQSTALNEQAAGLTELRTSVGNLANRVEAVHRRQDVLAAQNLRMYWATTWTPTDPAVIPPWPEFPPEDNAP